MIGLRSRMTRPRVRKRFDEYLNARLAAPRNSWFDGPNMASDRKLGGANGRKQIAREALCDAVQRAVGLSAQECKTLVNQIFEEIVATLECGEVVKLSSFGSFAVRQKRQRLGRDPRSGQPWPSVPAVLWSSGPRPCSRLRSIRRRQQDQARSERRQNSAGIGFGLEPLNGKTQRAVPSRNRRELLSQQYSRPSWPNPHSSDRRPAISNRSSRRMQQGSGGPKEISCRNAVSDTSKID
jgi:integration host factor subunit alpha